MKTLLRSLLFAALLLLGAAPSLFAQAVSTGIIAGFQPKEGTLTIRSDQTKTLMTFFGLEKANIYTADGKVVLLKDLPLGSQVTVEYAERGDKHWYIAKVILPAEVPPGRPGAAIPQGLQVNGVPTDSTAYRTAHDGDITTHADAQPGRVEAVKRR